MGCSGSVSTTSQDDGLQDNNGRQNVNISAATGENNSPNDDNPSSNLQATLNEKLQEPQIENPKSPLEPNQKNFNDAKLTSLHVNEKSPEKNYKSTLVSNNETTKDKVLTSSKDNFLLFSSDKGESSEIKEQNILTNSNLLNISNTVPEKSKGSQQNPETPKEIKNNTVTEKSTAIMSQSIEKVDNSTDFDDDIETAMQKVLDEQQAFDISLNGACLLASPDVVYQRATPNVLRLTLSRAPPSTLNLFTLLQRLPNLQELNVSGNSMGPQSFRALMVAMCHNSTIVKLNASNNRTDTETAESIGKMIACNRTLSWLDVSGNSLGKDYLSRCVGPELMANSSLKVLRMESCSAVDFSVLLEGVQQNSTLEEISLSHNEMSDGVKFARLLADCVKSPNSRLKRIEVRNCCITGQGITVFREIGLPQNNTLAYLNLGGNQCDSMTDLWKFLHVAMALPSLTSLIMDDIKTAEPQFELDDVHLLSSPAAVKSTLQTLSMSNCGLTDAFITHIAFTNQLALKELNLSNNPQLNIGALKAIVMSFTDAAGSSTLQKLTYGLNRAETLPAFLAENSGLKLDYLNIRKASVTPDIVGELKYSLGTTGLATLILDGIKLSGSQALAQAFSEPKLSRLSALSLGSCSLADGHLQPLCDALKLGLPLHMLKLSDNRITDTGACNMSKSLLAQRKHTLELIDLSGNKIGDEGALKVAAVLKQPEAIIHSLNLSNNVLGPEGVRAIIGALGCTCLTSVQLSNQQVKFEEDDMIGVFHHLASQLGLQVDESNVDIGVCGLPDLPRGLQVKLFGLGGYPGEIGRLLDSVSIVTDHRLKKLASLSLENILEMTPYLKGQDTCSDRASLSKQEWKTIVGADPESPSWLRIDRHRQNAVYMCNLPASMTVQKLEGILEMQADCSVKEVVLMKDPVLRCNSGIAWVLMMDTESVEKARQFFLDGEAQVFGTPFMICRLNVQVDDVESTKTEAIAREEMETRQLHRTVEDTAHRALLQRYYTESQERHAYRLAHPAYADGRIW